jgi:hypothetical protein
MYVLGGVVGAFRRDTTASVLKFDSAEDAWRQVAPMPEPRSDFAACAIGSDIFVFGGRNTLRTKQASVLKYDTEANTWSNLALMPDADHDIHASELDGLVYIVGADSNGRNVLRFDPVSGAWSTLAETLTSRFRGSSFVLGGCLYAVGGSTSSERYDAANNTWSAVADTHEVRSCFGAVTIGSVLGPAEEQDLFNSLIGKAASRGD